MSIRDIKILYKRQWEYHRSKQNFLLPPLVSWTPSWVLTNLICILSFTPEKTQSKTNNQKMTNLVGYLFDSWHTEKVRRFLCLPKVHFYLSNTSCHVMLPYLWIKDLLQQMYFRRCVFKLQCALHRTRQSWSHSNRKAPWYFLSIFAEHF